MIHDSISKRLSVQRIAASLQVCTFSARLLKLNWILSPSLCNLFLLSYQLFVLFRQALSRGTFFWNCCALVLLSSIARSNLLGHRCWRKLIFACLAQFTFFLAQLVRQNYRFFFCLLSLPSLLFAKSDCLAELFFQLIDFLMQGLGLDQRECAF